MINKSHYINLLFVDIWNEAPFEFEKDTSLIYFRNECGLQRMWLQLDDMQPRLFGSLLLLPIITFCRHLYIDKLYVLFTCQFKCIIIIIIMQQKADHSWLARLTDMCITTDSSHFFSGNSVHFNSCEWSWWHVVNHEIHIELKVAGSSWNLHQIIFNLELLANRQSKHLSHPYSFFWT